MYLRVENHQLQYLLAVVLLSSTFCQYLYIGQRLSWQSAHRYCRQKGAHLIGDGGDTQIEVLAKKTWNLAWTIIRKKHFDYLTWFNNSALQYTTTSKREGTCGYLDGIGRRIYSDLCKMKHHFICQFQGCTTCQKKHVECILQSGRCYWLSTVSLSWYDARNNCTKDGGDLADRIDDAAIMHLSSVLWDKLNTEFSYFWLGLRTSDWVLYNPGNVTPIKYYKWGTDGPNELDDCVALVRSEMSYYWRSQPCSTPSHFICKLNSTPDNTELRSDENKDEPTIKVNQTCMFTFNKSTAEAPVDSGNTEAHHRCQPYLMFIVGVSLVVVAFSSLPIHIIIHRKLRLGNKRKNKGKSCRPLAAFRGSSSE